jgi:hypothetical protein
MAICGCSSPARCCPRAVAGGVIYADLWGELSTHLAPAGFVYSEFSCAWTIATSFPLSKHTGGGDTAPTFSGQHVYLQFMWEVGLPPSPVEFSSHHCFYKLSHSWLLGVCRCSCLLGPVCLFTVPWGIAPPPASVLRTPCPLCYVSVLLLFIIQVFFFFLGGGQSVQGAMLIWPRVVCGSTTCRLAHLVVCVFPSGLGAGVWWRGSPPGFSF